MFEDITIEEFEQKNMNCGFESNPDELILTFRCKHLKTWEQFAEVLGNAFQLPMRNENADGTWDWMTDLDWIKRKRIIIYFLEAKEIKNNVEIMKFLNAIVVFWDEEVKTRLVP